MKKLTAVLLILFIVLLPAGVMAGEQELPSDASLESAAVTEGIPYWSSDSPALAEILRFVEGAVDPDSQSYIAPQDRIAVFDFDGTLFGELFPIYFDNCLFIHRALHDEGFEAPEDVKEYARALEEAAFHYLQEPESPRSTAQMTAEIFAGMSVEEYREYVRDFMAVPAYGFENMTYGEGFYVPMMELVRYLAEQDFRVFVSSGSERSMVRELISGTLDTWIPSERVIGSTFTLTATGQGETSGRNYTYTPEDSVLLEGNLTVKNQKANKVFSIVDEIGKSPVLVFGNSSGDLAMAEYCVQHGGMAFMLLCDDLERDYGNLEVAAKFKDTCEKSGFVTISMKNEFETIYPEGVIKTEEENNAGEQPSETIEEQTDAAA